MKQLKIKLVENYKGFDIFDNGREFYFDKNDKELIAWRYKKNLLIEDLKEFIDNNLIIKK